MGETPFRGRFALAAPAAFLLVACLSDTTPERLGPPERVDAVGQEIITAQRSAAMYTEAVTIKINNVFNDFCSGVIVAPRVALTASHCVVFNPAGTWTLVAPFAGGGSQTRTASFAEPIDAAFALPPVTRANYDSHPELRDLGFVYPDAPFTGIVGAILSPTQYPASTIPAPVNVSAVGRAFVSAAAGLVLSTAQPLSRTAAGDFYFPEYRTPRITDGGDSGGPLYIEGTHQIVGTERVFDPGNSFDYWTELFGATYTTILAKIDAHGGYDVLAPYTSSPPPKGALAFSVTSGLGGPYTWSISTNASGGTIDAVSGAYTAGATGSVTDIVKAADTAGKYGLASVSVGAGVTVAPVTVASTAPLGSLGFTASGGSGASFVWSFATNASGGTIQSGTGAYVAGPTGSVSDVVKATDSLGNTATRSVTVTAAIAISPTTKSLPPRGSQAFGATGGSGGYTFAVETNASGAAIGAGNGAYTAGTAASVIDIVSATDSFGAKALATVTVGAGVDITPKNPSAPVAGNITFTASGGSGTGYVWTLATNASGATLGGTGGYHAGNTGLVVDVVRATDSLGNTSTINVGVGMPLAIATPAPVVAPKGHLTFVGTGGSGAGFVWAVDPSGSGASIDPATGAYTAGTRGDVSDAITLTDSLGNTATLAENVGRGVAILPRVATLDPGESLALKAAGGSDTSFVFTFRANASGASLDAVGGVYTAGATGNVEDAIVVTDSLGNSDVANITVRAAKAAGTPGEGAKPPADPSPQGGSGCSAIRRGGADPETSAALAGALALLFFARRRARARLVQDGVVDRDLGE